MKLVLQIALGVFLGSAPALFMVETWWSYKQEQSKAETTVLLEQLEQNRLEQGDRLRTLLNQNQQANPALLDSSAGFSPNAKPTEQKQGK
ncbi:hypothetical protein [Methylomonas sp. AM2-LC]|uniref:hypothetical protein n=1 Tax=Methylomonas sp. AM2-LC TaxID=3153301 RepID=UPI003263627B